ncbi:conserved hypothetical protein [Gloeothece citriformis PCC 7424]|uniref:TIGR04376 family protein n=1 Tax=Gloeothece citriformis (strain PCC 7424) TaxID=65393 RepID=B7KKU3_GLOC7|nr:TIGR04376 family protein [Gloeothece citriformis]ACK71062.1 conserved hypothetical protein [Gloeothece citriformis PCC 7424]
MGLFEDVSHFLEERLDEFLKNNPHLELQALLEQLRQQEQDTIRLIKELEAEKHRSEQEILAVAQEIQTWHGRVNKAKSAGRLDLAEAAQEREAALLRQGNQLWGQMQGAKMRMAQSQELLHQIQQRKQEVQVKATQAQAQAQSNWDTKGWNQGTPYQTYNKASDPLEAEFKRWEIEDELEQMRKKL